ncbi:MAG: nitroreductase family protein [Pseudomonadota bacterium]
MIYDPRSDLQALFDARYGDAPVLDDRTEVPDLIRPMAARGSCRSFRDAPVPHSVLDMLCAVALASPTKSDLQQRDIILLQSPAQRQRLADLVSGQSWVAGAPMIVVFCGNNRRQRLLHEWHGIAFANDHLDAFFNAAGDAAIALGAFVTAAEATGLGCCPISAVRNEPEAVSEMLNLPDHVFPFAGLAVGYPSGAADISKRLPLRVTCHTDRYSEGDLRHAVEGYDLERSKVQPYEKQRFAEAFGEADSYGWSDDKVRQYSRAERSNFGKFVRAKGFNLD